MTIPLNKLQAKADPAPLRLSFYQRWQLTLFFFGFNLVIGLPFQFVIDSGPTWVWFAMIASLALGVVVVDYTSAPERLADLERRRWLANVPRTPDGGALINRDDFKRHFPS